MNGANVMLITILLIAIVGYAYFLFQDKKESHRKHAENSI